MIYPHVINIICPYVVNTPLSRSAYARHIIREVYVSLVVCYTTVGTLHRQTRICIITRTAININADMIPGQRTTHAIRQPDLDYIIAPALHETPRCPRRRKILRLLHRDQLESLRTRNGRPLPTNRETIHSSTNKRTEVRIHHIASERLFHCHRKSSPHISDSSSNVGSVFNEQSGTKKRGKTIASLTTIRHTTRRKIIPSHFHRSNAQIHIGMAVTEFPVTPHHRTSRATTLPHAPVDICHPITTRIRILVHPNLT